tara:strand:- start:238 stop:453 length:216 start_codon:yes stop_codon:yes gene_type:complete
MKVVYRKGEKVKQTITHDSLLEITIDVYKKNAEVVSFEVKGALHDIANAELELMNDVNVIKIVTTKQIINN